MYDSHSGYVALALAITKRINPTLLIEELRGEELREERMYQIVKLREEDGLTNRKIGERFNLDYTTISRYYNQNRNREAN